MADLMPLACKRHVQFACALTGPAQRRHRIAPGRRVHQRFQQLPLSSRWNVLPVKLKYWSLVLPHEHSACALVELMQIGKTPSGANPVLHHTPEAFNGIQVVTTVGWKQMQPKLFVPVSQRRRELFRPVDATA